MLLFEIDKYKSKAAAITEDNRIVTYKELIYYSDLIYSVIQHRCLIFCLCQNTLGSLCGYVSFISNNVVPLMLDGSIDKELLNELIKEYAPEYLWLPSERHEEFEGTYIHFSNLGYSLVCLNADVHYPLNDNLRLLLTTSGSTGSPKLVRLSYENIESNARSIAEFLSIDDNERPVTTLPMSYSYGLSVINSHLYMGATLLLTPQPLMKKEFWNFIKANKATSLSGVPYTYEILKKLRFFSMKLPFLKTLTQSGGKLSDDINKAFSEFCIQSEIRFFPMYGQTEATARMTYLPSPYILSKLGSIGVAIPGGELELIDENGKCLEGGEVMGELVYKGKNVSMGYSVHGEDLIKGDENNGVLYTGDIARRDTDGFYYIVGRKKRFIKIYGYRVNLDETERLLKKIIPDCACTGKDDNMVIYITDITKANEVKEYIANKTGLNHLAFTVKYIDQIPRNLSGKTIYTKLNI